MKRQKIELDSKYYEVLINFIKGLPRLERLTKYEFEEHYIPHMLTIAYFLKNDTLLMEALIESRFLDKYGTVDPVNSRELVKWLIKDT